MFALLSTFHNIASMKHEFHRARKEFDGKRFVELKLYEGSILQKILFWVI